MFDHNYISSNIEQKKFFLVILRFSHSIHLFSCAKIDFKMYVEIDMYIIYKIIITCYVRLCSLTPVKISMYSKINA